MQHKPLNALEAGRVAPTPFAASGVSSGFVTQTGAPSGLFFILEVNSGNQSS